MIEICYLDGKNQNIIGFKGAVQDLMRLTSIEVRVANVPVLTGTVEKYGKHPHYGTIEVDMLIGPQCRWLERWYCSQDDFKGQIEKFTSVAIIKHMR